MTGDMDKMRSTEALTGMGLSVESIKAIETEIDGFALDVINTHSELEIQKIFEYVNYIYIAQNIRETGVVNANIPENIIKVLTTLELIKDSQWRPLRYYKSYILTDKGKAIAQILVKDTLSKLNLADFSGVNPFTLMYILTNKGIGTQFFKRDLSDLNYSQGLIPLHKISQKFFLDCKKALTYLKDKRLAGIAHMYVSTEGGKLQEERYLVLPELTPEYFYNIMDIDDYSRLMQSYDELHNKLAKHIVRDKIFKELLNESRINAYTIQSQNTLYDSELINILNEINNTGSIIIKDDVKQGRLCDNPMFVSNKVVFLQKVQELSRSNTFEIEKLQKSIDSLPFSERKKPSLEKRRIERDRKKQPPVKEVEKQKPESFAQGGINILLGYSTEGKEIRWWPTREENKKGEANPHFLVVGGSGAGKSNTLKLIVSQLWNQKIPCLILDFKNEYGDVAEPLENSCLNPLEITYKSPKEIKYEVSSIVANVFKLGDQQEAELRKVIGECYHQKGITDKKDTWNLTPPTFADVKVRIGEKITDKKTRNNVRNTLQALQNRLDPLFDLELFQGKSMPFEQIIQKPVTIYLRNLPSDEIKKAVGDLILRKLWYYVQWRGINKLDHFCIIDEAHRLDYEKSAMIMFLREARSYGVGMILSSQFPRDFTGPAMGLVAGFLSLQLADEEDASPVSKRIPCKKEDIQQLTELGEGLIRFGSEMNPFRIQVSKYPLQ